MSRIPKEVIDQIIDAADILEVVGEYVPLKRKGGQHYWACCPFHHEKSPSFSVSPGKAFYKCFGCGKSGDVVQFVIDFEGVSYPEALRTLAKKYAIVIPEANLTDQAQQAQHERDSLFIVSDWASQYYHGLLKESDDGQAIGYSYLKERGLNLATIETFGLGYSLELWEGLLKAAEAGRHSIPYLEKAGLVIKREPEAAGQQARLYDRFRGRVMFPIHNVSGRVVGFGARTLKRDDKSAKYLNSPESEIYHKSEVLYGLFQARTAIRQQELCYLVEGYLDVLSLHQGGITNVVASSGTSLTESQVRLLKRYTENVTVLYDGDPAGIKASLRGIDLLLEGGLNVRVVLFPDGDDPDSYIRRVGDQAFAAYIEQHSQDFIAFKTTLAAEEGGTDPIKRAEAIRDVLLSIAKIPDGLKRQVFLVQTAQSFGFEEQLIFTEYNKLLKQGSAAAMPVPSPLAEVEAHEPTDVLMQCEQAVLRLLVLYGACEIEAGVSVTHYLLSQLDSTPLQTSLYAQLWELCRENFLQGRPTQLRTLAATGTPEARALLAHFATEREDLSPNWRIKDIYVPTEINQLRLACENSVLRLNKCRVQRERQACITQLNDPLISGDEQLNTLLRYNELTKLDNQLAQMLGTVVARSC